MTPSCTSHDIRQFLVSQYQPQLVDLGIDPAAVPDGFDFLVSGVVDSLGVLEMISSIEQKFGIAVDLESLDAEQLTLLGPLSDYIAATAVPSQQA